MITLKGTAKIKKKTGFFNCHFLIFAQNASLFISFYGSFQYPVMTQV